MQKNTSVTLGEHFERFLGERVHSGRYGSKSETIRAGLRLLEEHGTKVDALRRVLLESDESGTSGHSLKALLADT
jgi:antitoxin ParD1/3/4